MIRLSKLPFKTAKSEIKGSDNKGTELLLRSGLIRQTMAGVYTYTTLGYKVFKNIEQIVREEMDNYGAFEIFMPALSPRELWEKTGRWDTIDVAFHVPAANNKEFSLNSTHEELVTPLLGEFIQSYKDLPTCVYQIQNKFRNEKRSKSGLLRGREFSMKDAYSFHASNQEFEKYYDGMKEVYLNICNRLGLGKDTVIAVADGGTFTDKYSHEFQVRIGIGEDDIFYDKKSGVYFNKEVTPSLVGQENITENKLNKKEDILAKGVIGVEALAEKLGVPAEKSTKTMLFNADGKLIVASVRGDYEINTIKLQKILGAKNISFASPELVLDMTGAEIGYAGVINLPEGIELYLDDSIKGLTNFETGTNKTGYHSININFGVDLEVPEKFYDFKEVKAGDKNPESGEVYEVFAASEIGNIFPLETKFTKAFGVKYMDENNKEQTPIMGCYGFGVSRAMGLIAEYFSNNNGISWPEAIAPATHYIIVMGDDNLTKAEELAKEIELSGGSVLLDDRTGKKFGFGQKAQDCELLGIPNRIVVSPKTLDAGGYELKIRDGKEEIVKF